MITDLWIENFKGICKRQHIPLRPVTLLFGANNAGKSTVLRALLYLREIIENRDCDPDAAKDESGVEFGGVGNMVHIDERGFRSNVIRIGCRATFSPANTAEIDDETTDLGETGSFLTEIIGMLQTATIEVTIKRGPGAADRAIVSATEISINDRALCRIEYACEKATVRFSNLHPLLWTQQLAALHRPFEEYLVGEGCYRNFNSEFSSRLEVVDFLYDNLDDRIYVPLAGNGKLFELDAWDEMPTEGIVAIVPLDLIWHLLHGPDEHGEEHGFSEHAILVMDGSDGRWIPWGLIGGWQLGEDELMDQKFHFLSGSLKDSEHVLNANVWRALDNCWHSVPNLTSMISLASEASHLSRTFQRDSAPQKEVKLPRELRDALVDLLLRGPILAVHSQICPMIQIGPKRRDVPRTLSSQTAWGLTSWRDGSNAWKTLLDCDDQVFDEVSRWLGATEFLNVGAKLHREFSILLDSNSLEKLRIRVAESENPKDAIAEIDDIIAGLPQHRVLRLVVGRRSLQFQDVGEGLTQVVPILVALAAHEGLVTVEQPELHLHPALQACLADVLLQVLKFPNERATMIETHSEHLILRILRRIRQTTDGELPDHISPVKPDDVCVLWVDNHGEGTVISRLRISDNGRWLDRWPDGFFRERHEELFE